MEDGVMGKNQAKQELPAGFVKGGRRSQEFIDNLGFSTQDVFPRNREAYEAIASGFPGFSFAPGEKIVEDGTRRFVKFEGYPRYLGDHPSLATLLLESQRATGEEPIFVPDAFPPEIARKVAILRELLGGFADDFVKMLMALPAIMPPRKIIHALAGWIKEAREGQPITVFSAVCPPYSFRETGDPKRPFEYTFDGLHDGVGIVAKNVLNAIVPISSFFRDQGWDVRFLVAMADFEGDSPETLERVGLTHGEFMDALRASQQAFL